jgi:hypothetical protein
MYKLRIKRWGIKKNFTIEEHQAVAEKAQL